MPSLIPRPSHRPVFYRLQYKKKNGGGRPGIFYHVNDISVYLDRQRGGQGEESPSKEHAFFVSNLERYVFHFANV